jgi:hypothetical protein
MRTLIVVILLLPLRSRGQQIIARTAEQQNVYLDIKNPIIYKFCDRASNDTFKSSNGTVDFIHDTLFVTPTSEHERTVITVFRKDWWNIINRFTFTTVRADRPTLLLMSVMGAAHESAGKGIDWRRATRLQLAPPSNISHLRADTCSGIISFKVSLVAADGSFDETYYSYSDTIPSAIVRRIKSLHSESNGEHYRVKVHEIRVYAKWYVDHPFYLPDYSEEWYY